MLDRPALEQRACECYAVVKRELDRLLRLPGRAEAPQLSTFIQENMEEIVAEWEAFARTLLPAAATMSSARAARPRQGDPDGDREGDRVRSRRRAAAPLK